MKNALLVLLFLFLAGCSTQTSVILGVTNQDLIIKGFGRGHSAFGLQCIACPHIGAEISITTLDGITVCSGRNELIVAETENSILKVKCPGLEKFENATVIVQVKGFIGGRSEDVREFNFEKETVVLFEKV